MPETSIEQRLRAALHAPVATDPRARDRIMVCVRDAARRESPAHPTPTRHLRPRYSIAGLALAAGFGSIAAVRSFEDLAPVARAVAPITIASGPVRDTIASAFLDTVRLVQQWSGGSRHMMLERRYAVVVDMTRFVPDPAAVRLRGDDGRVYTLLHSARVTD